MKTCHSDLCIRANIVTLIAVCCLQTGHPIALFLLNHTNYLIYPNKSQINQGKPLYIYCVRK